MRRKDKLVTDLTLLHETIRNAKVCRLGLVDGSDPYVIPLSFGFDGKNLYFHSADEGRKVDILKKNNRVCLEFEQDNVLIAGHEKPCHWGFRYFTVICNGTAEVVTGHDNKAYGLNQIIKCYNQEAAPYTFTEQELSRVLVYKVTINDMTGKVSE